MAGGRESDSNSGNRANRGGVYRITRNEQKIVEKVDGLPEGKAGDVLTYRVIEYSREYITGEIIDTIKWQIKADDTIEELEETGEEINLIIRNEWAGKEIIVMAYYVEASEDISAKTWCYVLDHEILKHDRQLNILAATGEIINPNEGSEEPAQTICQVSQELNLLKRDDIQVEHQDILKNDKIVNSIKLFQYSYMNRKKIEQCRGDIDREIIIAMNRALHDQWRYTGNEKTREYRTNGTYVGERDFDYFGGIWVENDYLKNLDGSVMKVNDFKDLVGTIYIEASPGGSPNFGARVNEEILWREAAGIYCVIRNRANYTSKTLINIASDKTEVSGWIGKDTIPNIFAVTMNGRTRNVIKGFITANRSGHDYSNNAYFWDGKDIKTNAHYTYDGVTFSDPNHNIYALEDLRLKKTFPGSSREYYYTYISTNAIGGTIFWKYTDEFKYARSNNREYK